jgi:hypothetical protein
MSRLLSSCVVSVILAILFPDAAQAGTLVNQSPEQRKQTDEQAVFVTGSLIPQRIKKKRIGTTSVSPIRIIDRAEIDQTGRRTTRGILVADPSIRVTDH